MSQLCSNFPFGFIGYRDIENVMLQHQLDVAAMSRHCFEVSFGVAFLSLRCRDINNSDVATLDQCALVYLRCRDI